MLYITSDHAGLNLKNKIFAYLDSHGYKISNEPPHDLVPDDDYPDYVIPVMRKLQNEPESKAIVICRNGVGVNIAANKFKGIRAGISWTIEHAQSSRKHDDTNVLSLPADYISETDAYNIVDTWLNTSFSGEERHTRRLNKIKEAENRQL